MNRILFFAFLLFSVAVSAQRLKQPVAHHINSGNLSTTLSAWQVSATSLPGWEEKEAYMNGFSRVLKDGSFSFINSSGHLIAPLQFEDARNFIHHLAAVKKDAKWGFINEQGVLIVPCQYEIVYDFNADVTGVLFNKKWQLINTKGQLITTTDISIFYGFKNNVAKIMKGNRSGTMNTEGVVTYNNENVLSGRHRELAPATTNAANDCPDNIDFENGNFNNWSCFTGFADSVGQTNVITVTPSAPIANRHKIISRTLPANLDAYGLFSTNPPDGSNFAVKLGNTRIGGEAERIQYKIRIPANDSNFSIRYDYAVVFQDPGHTAWTQPRFTAKLFDSSANSYIDCASFEYISTSSLPGFEISGVDSSVIFKPWATAFISLRGHAGQTLYLEFTTADCVRRGHWGYAYVDIESQCSHAIDVDYSCITGIAALNAPPGFQQYNWWNQNYTTILATGQHVVLDPAPVVNSTVWLEMIPFSDFGCRDTMHANITATFTPHFDVSESMAVCAPHLFTFHNGNLPSTSVTWNFGDGSNGVGDTATHVYSTPGTYIVVMNVSLPSGCNASSSDTIQIVQPTASFSYAAGNYCGEKNISFTAVTTNTDSLSWNFGDGNTVVTTQHTISHTYSVAGIYVPEFTLISDSSCRINVTGTDSIKIENINAGFSFSQQKHCAYTLLNFIDTSNSFFGIDSITWNYGDGFVGTGNNANHIYTAAGNYSVHEIVTGITGCRDTIIKILTVAVNSKPVASIAGPDSACQHSTLLFTSMVQSADSINSMLWINPAGSNGSGNTYNGNFLQPGTYSLQFIAGTVNGCYDTATHQIMIRPIPQLTLPDDIQLCNGSTATAIIFSGTISGADYSWTNSEPSIGIAANGTGNIVSFIAANNSASAVSATITVTPELNGCTGDEKTFTITVLPSPSSFQPANQTLCNRGTTDAVIFNSFTNAVTSATFSWINSTPSIGLPGAGTGNIPPFTAINDSNIPVTATITITASNNGCQGLPKAFEITVNPTPTILQPADQSLCNNTNSDVLHFESTLNNSSYSWTNDQPMIGLSPAGEDSIGSFTAIDTGTVAVTANIIVTAFASGCQSNPTGFTIQVNPTPAVQQPASQSLCTGNPTSLINFSGTISNTVYNWTNDLPSIGLPASGTGNLLSFNPNNIGITNTIATITVTPLAGNCAGSPKHFNLIIFPTPGMIQPLNQFQCNGETINAMMFMSPVAGVSFNWVNDLPSIGLPAAGSGNVPAFITTNTTNHSITASITITPATNDCPGIAKTFTITVDPTPDISQPANKTFCRGETVAATAFTGTVNGTTFTWINSAANIGLPAGGTGDLPSFTALNNTDFPVTAVIQVTGNANSCGSVVKVFTITVDPAPVVNPTADMAVCNGSLFSPVTLTGPVSGTTYSWKNNLTSIGLPATGTGNVPSFVAVNHTASPVTATIIVFGSNTNCTMATDSFTITVNPSPSIVANNNLNVCQGHAVQLSATGAVTYSWYPALGLSCTDCANPLLIAADSISYIVRGTSAAGCIATDTVLLMVRKPFNMLVPPDDTICAGRSKNLIAANAETYLWSPADGLDHTNIASPTATPIATTRYRVIGFDAYHCFTDTGYVSIIVGPKPTVNIGPDLTTTTGAPVTFTPVIQHGPIVRYTWTPAAELSCSDCASPVTTVKNNMMVSLTVENSYGCSAVDSIFITAFCKKAEVFVPNAFTPDGDGLNDILMIRGTGIMVKSFRVFNRWGEMIFEKQNFAANDPKYGWDGRIRGVPATPGVYVYTAEVVCDNGALYTYKGNTTIIK